MAEVNILTAKEKARERALQPAPVRKGQEAYGWKEQEGSPG